MSTSIFASWLLRQFTFGVVLFVLVVLNVSCAYGQGMIFRGSNVPKLKDEPAVQKAVPDEDPDGIYDSRELSEYARLTGNSPDVECPGLGSGQQTAPSREMCRVLKGLRSEDDYTRLWKTISYMTARVQRFEGRGFKGGRDLLVARSAGQIYSSGWRKGCIETAAVMAGMLRAVGFSVVFVHGVLVDWMYSRFQEIQGQVRTKYKGHTFLEISMEGRKYLIDSAQFMMYYPYVSQNPNLPRGYVVQYKGADLWSLGIMDRWTLHESMDRFVTKKMYMSEEYMSPQYESIELMLPYDAFISTLLNPEASSIPKVSADSDTTAEKTP